MAVSDDFIEYILDQLSGWGEVYTRRMFGGAGLYSDGLMFGLLANDVAYLKVDETNRDKFLDAGSEPFKPYPDRPTIMSYFEIPPDILEDRDELMKWAEESLSIQKKGK
jgi:DNA transformation protein